MHANLPLGASIFGLFICIIAGKPLLSTRLSPITKSDAQSQHPSHQSLTLIPISTNDTLTTLRPFPNTKPLPTPSNATVNPPEGLIPFHVTDTPTTLLFHTFGPKIPVSYMLDCLALSLSFVLEYTLTGKGNNLIKKGFFVHKHVLPDNDNVTIYVADFREIGKPMNYFALRDTISGIGDFMTEPTGGLMTLSYEIEVERKGYVGTGHVDYEVARSSA